MGNVKCSRKQRVLEEDLPKGGIMAEATLGYSYAYPRPALTVDLVVVTTEKIPRVLLIRRSHDPFAGAWALPGGFVDEGEALREAARRELQEETGVQLSELEQLQTFGDPGRDPRGWTVSVAYIARIKLDEVHLQPGDDADEASWFAFNHLPSLAFDHALILECARGRIRAQSRSRRSR